MPARPLRRSALALGAALLLAAPAAAQARDMFATDDRGNLLRFDHQTPGLILDRTPITGLPAGVALVGIDVRPSTGGLVGVGSDSVVYALDAASGAVAPIGAGFQPGLAGTSFGVDVNPVPDALRITGDAGMNYRIAFATGAHGAGSPDGALNPGTPRVVGSAYSNSAVTPVRPAGTTLFAIDAGADRLMIQSPPNAGTLVDVGPLRVDVAGAVGFDVAGTPAAGWLAARPAGGPGTVLYRVDLGTGRAVALGRVGTGSPVANRGAGRVTLTGLAARQDLAAPLAGNLPPTVRVLATVRAPRAGARVAYVAAGADPDGRIVRTEWDLDGDGAFDDARGRTVRVARPAGALRLAARVTDVAGATATATLRVAVR